MVSAHREGDPGLTRACLARVETLESLEVLWNPAEYRIARRQDVIAPAALGVAPGSTRARLAGGLERFETRLFLDTTGEAPGPGRDARVLVERLAAWMGGAGIGCEADEVAFVWGPFRFAGVLERLDEEWIRFDPDGTPVRAWVSIVLRRECA